MRISRIKNGRQSDLATAIYLSQIEVDQIYKHFNPKNRDELRLDIIRRGSEYIITLASGSYQGQPFGNRITKLGSRYFIKQASRTGRADPTPAFGPHEVKVEYTRTGVIPSIRVLVDFDNLPPPMQTGPRVTKAQRAEWAVQPAEPVPAGVVADAPVRPASEPATPPSTPFDEAVGAPTNPFTGEPMRAATLQEQEGFLSRLVRESIGKMEYSQPTLREVPRPMEELITPTEQITSVVPERQPEKATSPSHLEAIKNRVEYLNAKRKELKLVYRINKETGDIEVHRQIIERLF